MMNIREIKKEQWVERVQPNDYTDGRKGKVIDFDLEKNRVRVQWFLEPEKHGGELLSQGGSRVTGKGKKTWVNANRLIPSPNMDNVLAEKIKNIKN